MPRVLPLWLPLCGGLLAVSCPSGGPYPQPPAPVNGIHVLEEQVLLVRELRTCVEGERCTGGACAVLHGVRGEDVTLARNEHLRSYPPSEISTAPVHVCVSLELSDADVASTRREVERHADTVALDTEGGILLRNHVVEIPRLDVALAWLGNGFWLPPFALQEALGAYLDRGMDFVLLVHGVRDPGGAFLEPAACGLTYGADHGLAGAGYSWVPRTSSSFFYECAEGPVFTHEWLHQLEFARWTLSPGGDVYLVRGAGHAYPGCGAGEPDATRWFPSTHDCAVDPDSPTCGGPCGSRDAVNHHVLTAHFDRYRPLTANHCRDGVQDFNETGVDEGGNCGTAQARSRAAR